MSELEIKKQPGKNISLPIEWHVPEGMQSRYATNVVAQAGSSEIILTFSSKYELPKVKYVPSANQTIRIPDLIQVTAEIEPAIEEVVEDNEEQAWETFLDLEERYSNTNRWLAE